MYCSVYGIVHIKDALLLIGNNSSGSNGSGLPPSLSELSFTVCTMSYNNIYDMLSGIVFYLI